MKNKTTLFLAMLSLFFIASCMKIAQKALTIQEFPANSLKNAQAIRQKTPIKVADGLEVTLWASDSLAPDPVAMSIDDFGSVYLTRTNRNRYSEFDIRGHKDWMTESISFQTVADRRAFLRRNFDPARSKENEWLKDMNRDGVHDWRDLTVEKEEIWRLDDSNKDGIADRATILLSDFHEEISDVAGGLLVRAKDAFIACAPHVWHLENKNKEGVWQKKTAISSGYGVHIGFGGHNLSGVTEGPDGRIYWNIGDIGANITALDGKNYPNPNSGLIARSNPDGSDFEIFATGLRNTHEFVFDEYGNLISSDNDGDHPTERERLVHVVEGSDAGWRSNWQYGKYTDIKNNRYNVWMDEKLSVPRWAGQAAYIVPPIMNYHNGPTGMVYNPGTALGSEWKNKFFLVEFVGSAARSHIWSFGLKPKGASFELNGETDMLSGILPTGIQFGPDGALYAADWINGWDTKNYGRVWKIDVTKDKNDLAAVRLETQRLVQLNYAKQTPEQLYSLLFYADMRVRQKAQFELVNRGKNGLPQLIKATQQTENQLARVHGIWGIGQMARADKKHATTLTTLLQDKDPEIIAQAVKMLGDAQVSSVSNTLIALLNHPSARIQFYAAEALGQNAAQNAVQPLIKFLETNNDEDLYLRHAGVLALSRIGKIEPILALANSPNTALRTAAVLVLRRLKNENIKIFLNDSDEYIVTETARAINDDLSIPAALPALAEVLKEKKFTSEPLLRRAINAALRVGGEKELDILIDFAKRTDISDIIKAEALATIGTWANPSVLDRVDGRFRGKFDKNIAAVQAKIKPYITNFLKETNPETLVAMAGLLANLDISAANDQLAIIYLQTQENKVKAAILPALSRLKYINIATIIKEGMEDKDENVRTTALSLLNNSTVSKENLPAIVQSIFTKGGIKEQQQLLVVMSALESDKILAILDDLVAQMKDKKLSPNLNLELKEAVIASGSESLKAKLASIQPEKSVMGEYAAALYGGNKQGGFMTFTYNGTAQCGRCHAVNGDGANVGPNLSHIGSELSREQLLQALVEPSARIAPGYGNVSLKLKDGQEVWGILMKENDEALTLKTSDAEPLVIAVARIAKRENIASSMPALGLDLSKREVRDLVEYLSSLK
jgi:quinoprotein glucose dehydrogenase